MRESKNDRIDPRSGVRDFTAVDALARAAGLQLAGERAMPANNRSIWWIKKAGLD